MENQIPKQTAAYGQVGYWRKRFEKEECFEWFGDYSGFCHLLKPYLPSKTHVLILGNGTSRLPFDLIAEGCRDITATDICPNLIQKMKQK